MCVIANNPEINAILNENKKRNIIFNEIFHEDFDEFIFESKIYLKWKWQN